MPMHGKALCHGGLIEKTPDHLSVQDVYFSRTASWWGAELNDNTAPKIFHVKRQTQQCHVRHTIPYRLYHHYFFEHIKDRLINDIDRQPV